MNWKLAEGSCVIGMSESASLDDELAAHRRPIGGGPVVEVVMDMLIISVGLWGLRG